MCKDTAKIRKFANMITKNRIKFIRSLEQKKYRKVHGCFVVEGPKVVEDMLPAFECEYVACTREWLDRHVPLPSSCECDEVSEDELRRISFMEHPQQVLAVFRIPESPFQKRSAEIDLCLALDGVQNPGNLGTIIRISDWFGIEHVICSSDCADLYNPKVVQAAMGSLARVKVHYMDLPAFLRSLEPGTPIYGTLLDGDDLYETMLSTRGVIVMGNEGNGLSDEVRQLVTSRIKIPSFNTSGSSAESLNVGVATAVVCSEFKRRSGS